MAKRTYIFLLVCAALTLAAGMDCHAQRYPERRLIRQGNKDYEKGEWIESEVDYRRALEKTPDSYEAKFNLGNALYKQERYEEAEQIFMRSGADTTRMEHAATSHYNTGNALFQQRKLEEALEEYKETLRKNPNDTEAKFNLAYVKKMLEKDDDDQGGGGDDNDQDQNQDGNDNQDQSDQNQDKGDDGQDESEGNDDQNDNQPPSPQQEQPTPSGMTREEAERMLEAIQMNEDKTREKMDEQKAKVVGKSDKNW